MRWLQPWYGRNVHRRAGRVHKLCARDVIVSRWHCLLHHQPSHSGTKCIANVASHDRSNGSAVGSAHGQSDCVTLNLTECSTDAATNRNAHECSNTSTNDISHRSTKRSTDSYANQHTVGIANRAADSGSV